MKSFLITYLFLFLPKMNLTQEILWSYSHLGCIGIVVIIAIAAFFMSIFIYSIVIPKLVAEGYIVGKLSPAFSLEVAILCASLFKGTSYKN